LTPLSLLEVTPHEIVLCKPPGLASELPRDPQADSLLTRLRAHGFEDLRLVHRLDAPACGLMIVARTAQAAVHYAAEIEARRWHKVYIAEVASPVQRARALVGHHKAYLKAEGRRARVVRSGGKPSFLTIIQAEASVTATGRSHLLVQLHTGRFHQIRVMLAALGAPLAGDTLYGGPPEAPMYLEHVLLAARLYGNTHPRVWVARAHSGRPSWSAALADAVEARAASLLSEA
jgi:23S rRNA-/tRNA-specific pseudouridylate synthase